MESYTVAICTLGENQNLISCINNLLEIRKEFESIFNILVVVNKSRDESIPHMPSEIRVVFESQRGYSNVRNAALSNTPKDSNLIFIDDDELTTLAWFEAIKRSHEKFPDDLLFGPVFSTSQAEVPTYRNRFRKHFNELQDEAIVKQASTANLLIPASLIRMNIVKFDPIFNLSGSEDTDLCFRLTRLGYQIRFSKDAALFEVEKDDRFDSSYLDRRFIRDVSNYSFIIRKNSGALQIAKRFFTLAIRVFYYSLLLKVDASYEVRKTAYTNSLKSLVQKKLQNFI
jgi:GT2 family glycosyltransferase